MAANPIPQAIDPLVKQIEELQPRTLRQRIEALLREIFEGHEEYLGVTPD